MSIEDFTRRTRRVADGFAERWYARPDSGCDQETLASMVRRLLEDAYVAGAQEARQAVKASLVATLGLDQ